MVTYGDESGGGGGGGGRRGEGGFTYRDRTFMRIDTKLPKVIKSPAETVNRQY